MTEKSLFLLPFDHRSGFLEKELKAAKALKQIIYQGFLRAVESEGVPKKSAAILVDEWSGKEIIKDAILRNLTVCIATEKSGRDEFEFEYGNDFGQHLNKYRPDFAKALVHYNPEGNQKLNERQRQKLKKLNDFCQSNDYRFLLEPLTGGANKTRLKLMLKTIKELQRDGIEPDIWKIEGLETTKDYQKVVAQIKSGGRKEANVIVLGAGADQAQVEKWLLAGAKTRGIIGFAIGRTIFWQPLVDYKNKKISKETVISQISQKYQHFYRVFTTAK